MEYQGQIKDGLIVLDDPARLPEGARVTVFVEPEPTPEAIAAAEDLFQEMLKLVGPTGMPDLSTNIDHYLYGHPKVTDEE